MEQMKLVPIINKNFADLNPVILGYEACSPSHRFGPAVRDYYLLHCVFAGKGTFLTHGKVLSVGKNQYFLIRPKEVTTYEADAADPWMYLWIGFTGEIAKRFDLLPDTGELDFHLFSELLRFCDLGFEGWESMREEYIVTVLYRALASLNSEKSSGIHYERKAENYLRTMYMQDISVEKIAGMLSLDRRYLSRIFKARFGISMQEYLIRTRIEAAQRFLASGYSVSQAALLCGYRDPFNFSKMFKKRCGLSPEAFAKRCKAEGGGETPEKIEFFPVPAE